MVTRNTLGSYQKSAADIPPELDLDSLTQTDIDGWTSARFTSATLMTYAAFQGETGYAGAHPMGQSTVLKLVTDNSDQGNTIKPADTITGQKNLATAIDILNNTGGYYWWSTSTDSNNLHIQAARSILSDTGSTGFPTAFWQTDSPLEGADTAESWQACINCHATNAGVVGAVLPEAVEHVMYQVRPSSTVVTVYVTSYFVTPKFRTIVMLEQDDFSVDTDIFIEDLETYGFRGGLSGVSSNVNGAIVTEAELQTYMASGHSIFTHGIAGDAGGYRLIPPANTVPRNDGGVLGMASIDTELAFFRARGVPDSQLLHHSLPLGQNVPEVREYMRSLGFKTCRNVGSLADQSYISEYAPGKFDYLNLPGRGASVDTLATNQALVTEALRLGNPLLLYWHTYADDRAVFQAFLLWLKGLQDAGLIDVLPRNEWYDITERGGYQRTFL